MSKKIKIDCSTCGKDNGRPCIPFYQKICKSSDDPPLRRWFPKEDYVLEFTFRIRGAPFGDDEEDKWFKEHEK